MQMGIEYWLRFAISDEDAVAMALSLHPAARATSSRGFEFGNGDNGWSQATAQIDSDGVYFCDNRGSEGRAILGEVVAKLVAAFGPVVVEEL
jgi:hypothetical protein